MMAATSRGTEAPTNGSAVMLFALIKAALIFFLGHLAFVTMVVMLAG